MVWGDVVVMGCDVQRFDIEICHFALNVVNSILVEQCCVTLGFLGLIFYLCNQTINELLFLKKDKSYMW